VKNEDDNICILALLVYSLHFPKKKTLKHLSDRVEEETTQRRSNASFLLRIGEFQIVRWTAEDRPIQVFYRRFVYPGWFIRFNVCLYV
jgi:hypothetical protein